MITSSKYLQIAQYYAYAYYIVQNSVNYYTQAANVILESNVFNAELDTLQSCYNSSLAAASILASTPPLIIEAVRTLQQHVINQSGGTLEDWFDNNNMQNTIPYYFAELSKMAGYTIDDEYIDLYETVQITDVFDFSSNSTSEAYHWQDDGQEFQDPLIPLQPLYSVKNLSTMFSTSDLAAIQSSDGNYWSQPPNFVNTTLFLFFVPRLVDATWNSITLYGKIRSQGHWRAFLWYTNNGWIYHPDFSFSNWPYWVALTKSVDPAYVGIDQNLGANCLALGYPSGQAPEVNVDFIRLTTVYSKKIRKFGSLTFVAYRSSNNVSGNSLKTQWFRSSTDFNIFTAQEYANIAVADDGLFVRQEANQAMKASICIDVYIPDEATEVTINMRFRSPSPSGIVNCYLWREEWVQIYSTEPYSTEWKEVTQTFTYGNLQFPLEELIDSHRLSIMFLTTSTTIDLDYFEATIPITA